MAKHVSNFTKDSDDIVLDLINEQNGTALTSVQVSTKTTGATNTKAGILTATAKTGSGYRGSVAMNYNRVMLGEMFGVFIPEGQAVEINNSMTVSEVIDVVNARFGINLTAKDIFIDGVDLVTAGTTMVNVSYDNETVLGVSADYLNPHVEAGGPAQLAKVWTGAYNLRLTQTAQALADTWGVTTLDGLYPPGTGSPAEGVGDYSYIGNFYGTNVADMANVGQSLSMARYVNAMAISTQTGDGVNHSTGGYVDIYHKVGSEWVIQQTIEAPADISRFGQFVAMSGNGTRLAISTNDNSGLTVPASMNQHKVHIYARNVVTDPFELIDTYSPSGLSPTVDDYKIGGNGTSGMTFVSEEVLAYFVSEDSQWNAANTNTMQFVVFDEISGEFVRSYSTPLNDASMPLGVFDIRIVVRNFENIDVVFMEVGDPDFATTVQSLQDMGEGFVILQSPSQPVSWPVAYSDDGNVMLLGNGKVYRHISGEGDGTWDLVSDLRAMYTGNLQRFIVNAAHVGNAFVVLNDLVAQEVNTGQSSLMVFRDAGGDQYSLEAVLRCPRVDESSDRNSYMSVFGASWNGMDLFGVEPGMGAIEDGENSVYDFGVVHHWKLVQIS